ncbi:hypothetical protein DdX_15724 [Ditylenchus destructor]|uniref:F-box domain-containing protein n=1 Tax=Ditylenchus destructor TaxID=166010 RepID=A0AAD4MRM7_9BILA|nr:hypothetical protein DdX_15724 [Ditylenchus destructor]
MRRSARLAERQAKIASEAAREPKAKKIRSDDRNHRTLEVKNVRRSARLAEKRKKLINEAPREPKAKKSRSDFRTTNVATIDNGTMVEVFKYLNYCQLAKNSLVSKRFRDLIQIHRHSFALLYVDTIGMERSDDHLATFNIFNQKLSTKEHNEWIIRNGYSKRVSLEDRVLGKRRTKYERKTYQLSAYADYNVPIHRRTNTRTTVFLTRAELHPKNWPSFQHFVRLLTDPFVSIRWIELTAQNDVLNLMTGAMNPDRCRIQCRGLTFNLEGDAQKFISWVKDHVCCYEIHVNYKCHNSGSDCDKELVDLFVTGAPCTSAIMVQDYDLHKVIAEFVQKFMDLKSQNEYQMVGAIQGKIADREVIEVLKRNHIQFVKEDVKGRAGGSTEQVIEFVNSDVGKKLELSYHYSLENAKFYYQSCFFLHCKNL